MPPWESVKESGGNSTLDSTGDSVSETSSKKGIISVICMTEGSLQFAGGKWNNLQQPPLCTPSSVEYLNNDFLNEARLSKQGLETFWNPRLAGFQETSHHESNDSEARTEEVHMYKATSLAGKRPFLLRSSCLDPDEMAPVEPFKERGGISSLDSTGNSVNEASVDGAVRIMEKTEWSNQFAGGECNNFQQLPHCTPSSVDCLNNLFVNELEARESKQELETLQIACAGFQDTSQHESNETQTDHEEVHKAPSALLALAEQWSLLLSSCLNLVEMDPVKPVKESGGNSTVDSTGVSVSETSKDGVGSVIEQPVSTEGNESYIDENSTCNDSEGMSPWLLAASSNKALDIVRILMKAMKKAKEKESYIDENETCNDSKGMAALHLAASAGHTLDIVRILMNAMKNAEEKESYIDENETCNDSEYMAQLELAASSDNVLDPKILQFFPILCLNVLYDDVGKHVKGRINTARLMKPKQQINVISQLISGLHKFYCIDVNFHNFSIDKLLSGTMARLYKEARVTVRKARNSGNKDGYSLLSSRNPKLFKDEKCSSTVTKFVQRDPKRIGKGGNGEVVEGFHDNKPLAIKETTLKEVELSVVPTLKHKNLLPWFALVRGQPSTSRPGQLTCYQIFDRMTEDLGASIKSLGGSIHDNMVQGKKSGFSRTELSGRAALLRSSAAMVFRETLQGLEYLHSRLIVHRDIKASNILVKRPSSCTNSAHNIFLCDCTSRGQWKVRIADLDSIGHSDILRDQSADRSRRSGVKRAYIDIKTGSSGTRGYGAPENSQPTLSSDIHDKDFFNPAADIWSFGCVGLHVAMGYCGPHSQQQFAKLLLASRGVLSEEDRLKMVNKTLSLHHIQQGFPGDKWKELVHFVGQPLKVDPKNRPSAAALLEHPYLNQQGSTLPSAGSGGAEGPPPQSIFVQSTQRLSPLTIEHSHARPRLEANTGDTASSDEVATVQKLVQDLGHLDTTIPPPSPTEDVQDTPSSTKDVQPTTSSPSSVKDVQTTILSPRSTGGVVPIPPPPLIGGGVYSAQEETAHENGNESNAKMIVGHFSSLPKDAVGPTGGADDVQAVGKPFYIDQSVLVYSSVVAVPSVPAHEDSEGSHNGIAAISGQKMDQKETARSGSTLEGDEYFAQHCEEMKDTMEPPPPEGKIIFSTCAEFLKGSMLPLPSAAAMADTIGKGGNGVVSYVYHNGKEFAVKETCLREEEMRTLSKLSGQASRNVLPISAVMEGPPLDRYHGRRACYQLMPRATGDVRQMLDRSGSPTLWHYLCKYKPEPAKYSCVLANTRVVLRQALRGLQHLHSKGIVHRDVKLQNILLDMRCGCGDVFLCPHKGRDSYRVYLADFDSALDVERARGKLEERARKGSVLRFTPYGTQGYRAPETSFFYCSNQVLSPEPLSLATRMVLGSALTPYLNPAQDLWSFGCTVLKLFTRFTGSASQREVASVLLADCLRRSTQSSSRYQHSVHGRLTVDDEEMKKLLKVSLVKPLFPLAVELQDLIRQCLQVDPHLRPSAEQCANLPFFKPIDPATDKNSYPSEPRQDTPAVELPYPTRATHDDQSSHSEPERLQGSPESVKSPKSSNGGNTGPPSSTPPVMQSRSTSFGRPQDPNAHNSFSGVKRKQLKNDDKQGPGAIGPKSVNSPKSSNEGNTEPSSSTPPVPIYLDKPRDVSGASGN